MKIRMLLLAVILLLGGCGGRELAEEPEEEMEPASAEDSDAFYEENGHTRVQLNLLRADLTHDGIDELVETYMYFPPETDLSEDLSELIQQYIWQGEVKVRVYDGSKGSPENPGAPIWERGYSAVHAGNGQVSIVYREGLAYLLESSLWQGQGAVAYSYEVIRLDIEGRESVVDEESIDLMPVGTDTAEEALTTQIDDFKERIAPWYEDGQLLVATDVDLEQQLIRTAKQPLSPQAYYDIVWSRWDERPADQDGGMEDGVESSK